MDTFLKAYYLTEDDAERWLREHFKVRALQTLPGRHPPGVALLTRARWIALGQQDFSSKQLVSIISTGVGVRMSKKARQSALQLIEDLDKQRR